MSYFDGYHNKALVVIPPHHELRRRTNRRNEEMGSPVPEDAINAMKGEFVLLRRECCFSQFLVSFTLPLGRLGSIVSVS